MAVVVGVGAGVVPVGAGLPYVAPPIEPAFGSVFGVVDVLLVLLPQAETERAAVRMRVRVCFVMASRPVTSR